MPVCIVCGRQLTDPLSIKLGIGPVCAMERKDQAAMDRTMSLFPEAHASYSFTVHGSVVAIVDLDRGGRSVTNDIEHILTEIAAEGGLPAGRPILIVYRDSDGVWDGVRLREGRFAGFIPLRQQNIDDARRAVLEWARRGRA